MLCVIDVRFPLLFLLCDRFYDRWSLRSLIVHNISPICRVLTDVSEGPFWGTEFVSRQAAVGEPTAQLADSGPVGHV